MHKYRAELEVARLLHDNPSVSGVEKASGADAESLFALAHPISNIVGADSGSESGDVSSSPAFAEPNGVRISPRHGYCRASALQSVT